MEGEIDDISQELYRLLNEAKLETETGIASLVMKRKANVSNKTLHSAKQLSKLKVHAIAVKKTQEMTTLISGGGFQSANKGYINKLLEDNKK